MTESSSALEWKEEEKAEEKKKEEEGEAKLDSLEAEEDAAQQKVTDS